MFAAEFIIEGGDNSRAELIGIQRGTELEINEPE
jgi:hypothetical protein